jgi:hypothetical protein
MKSRREGPPKGASVPALPAGALTCSVLGASMARCTNTQLQQFRRNSDCEGCVHFLKGCPLFIAVLLANEEEWNTPGLDLLIDIDLPCPMFFAQIGKSELRPYLGQRSRNSMPSIVRS